MQRCVIRMTKDRPMLDRENKSADDVSDDAQKIALNIGFFNRVASGKRLHNYGKSPFLMGKLTIPGHFQ